MKKKFLGLFLIGTLILGLSSCSFILKQAKFYLNNDTQYNISDWAMVSWNEFKNDGYIIDESTTIYSVKDVNPVAPYTIDGPAKVPYDKDETYFPVFIFEGYSDTYIAETVDENNNHTVYTCPADGDYQYSLTTKIYSARAAIDSSDSIEDLCLKLEDGTILKIVPINEIFK